MQRDGISKEKKEETDFQQERKKWKKKKTLDNVQKNCIRTILLGYRACGFDAGKGWGDGGTKETC
jgi:hypothetical protein